MKKLAIFSALLSLSFAFVGCSEDTTTKGPAIVVMSESNFLKADEMYSGMHDFCEGLCRVRENELAGFINKSGKLVIPCQFESVRDFSDGFAAFKKDDKFGFINRKGEEVIPAIYDDVSDFHEGIARVKIEKDDEDLYGYIDNTGAEIIAPIYNANSKDCVDGIIVVAKGKQYSDEQEYCILDKTGKPVTETTFKFLGEPSEGLISFAVIKKHGWSTSRVYGYVDYQGVEVIPASFDDADEFKEGLAGVEKNDEYGFINKTGEYAFYTKFDDVSHFNESMAIVEKDKKLCAIDTTGTVKFTLRDKYSFEGEEFHDGMILVKRELPGQENKKYWEKDYEYGFFNAEGEELVECKYRKAEEFVNGETYVMEGWSKVYILNNKGEVTREVED